MAKLSTQDARIRFGTAGVEFAVTVGLLTAGGVWLDRRLDSLPLCTLLGLALGFAAALYRLIRQARSMHPTDPADASDESET